MTLSVRNLILLAALGALLTGGCRESAKDERKPSASAEGASAADAEEATPPAAQAEVSSPRGYQQLALIPERNEFRDRWGGSQTEAKPATGGERDSGIRLTPSGEGEKQSEEDGDTIAVTGCVRVRGVAVALVENLTTEETELVREGNEAFGYLVASVDHEGATLRKGGKERYFPLGANKLPESKGDKKDEKKTDDKKSESKPPSSPPSSSGALRPSYSGRPSSGGMSDEMRQRIEEMRRRYGSGGPRRSSRYRGRGSYGRR